MDYFTQSKNHQIRVFISSTFHDMQAERDILIKNIFPQLRKICEERAVTWTEVDLRWGITDEQKAEGKVLPLCLEEIDRCAYFIGLLGERYGWVPDSIPIELLEAKPWLKQYLKHSVTELEIINGVFIKRSRHSHTYLYFRDPDYVKSIPIKNRRDFTEVNLERAKKLRNLKYKIQVAHREQVCKLREGYINPEQLGEWILEDFSSLINSLYPIDHVPDPLDQEAERHEAYAKNRRLAFIGREELLSRLNEYASKGGKPLVLTGESGCGKSSLLAEWVARWRTDHPEDLVIQHYIGSTPDSADWQRLVRRVISELKHSFYIHDKIPLESDDLQRALNDWTVKASDSRRVVLVLDALNQLAEDGVAQQLGWLPIVFPKNFRVLVSSLPGNSLDVMRKRNWSELNLPRFTRVEIVSATRTYFNIFSKTPPKDIIAKLEVTPAACNAFYLRAFLDELRQLGKYEELNAKATEYLSANDPKELYERIFTRWEKDFGVDLVSNSLKYLWASRQGLSETEWLDLLGKNNSSLPRQLFTPLFLNIEPHLALRAGLYGFGHDFLSLAVEAKLLPTKADRNAAHLALASYFANHQHSMRLAIDHRCQSNEKTQTIPPSIRCIQEWPWQLWKAKSWRQLCDCVAEIETFRVLYKEDNRNDMNLYWRDLRQYFDPVEVYRNSLSAIDKSDELFLAAALNDVGHFLEHSGRCQEAYEVEQKSLEIQQRVLGNKDARTLKTMNNLAVTCWRLHRLKEAERLYRHILAAREEIYGPESSETAEILNNMSVILYAKGDLEGTESNLRRAVDIWNRTLGPNHKDTLRGLRNLGSFLLDCNGETDAAETICNKLLERAESTYGPDHEETLISRCSLAKIMVLKGDPIGARQQLEEVLAILERTFGQDHPETVKVMGELALLFCNLGEFRKAENLYRYALDFYDSTNPNGEEAATIANSLGVVLFKLGIYDDAEHLYRRALAFDEKYSNPNPFSIGVILSNLSKVLDAKGKLEDADPYLERSIAHLENALLKSSNDANFKNLNLATWLSSVAEMLERRGKLDAAKRFEHEAKDIRATMHGLKSYWK